MAAILNIDLSAGIEWNARADTAFGDPRSEIEVLFNKRLTFGTGENRRTCFGISRA